MGSITERMVEASVLLKNRIDDRDLNSFGCARISPSSGWGLYRVTPGGRPARFLNPLVGATFSIRACRFFCGTWMMKPRFPTSSATNGASLGQLRCVPNQPGLELGELGRRETLAPACSSSLPAGWYMQHTAHNRTAPAAEQASGASAPSQGERVCRIFVSNSDQSMELAGKPNRRRNSEARSPASETATEQRPQPTVA